MGRTKSWLALVLAIVMVLGMAVPTAFAAEITGGMSFYDGATVISPTATEEAYAYPLVVNGDSVTVDLHAVTAGINLNTRALAGDKAAKIEITNDYDDYVEVTTGDGTITVKPLGNITYADKGFFTVKVSAPEGADNWGPVASPTTWGKGDFFQQAFYFTVKPMLEVVSPVNLNIGTLGERTKTLTIASVPSNEAISGLKYSYNNADWKTDTDRTATGFDVEVVAVGTTKYLQVTGKVVGSYPLYIKGAVGDMDVAEPTKVTINVANSANDDGYAIKLDKTELVVDRLNLTNFNVTASVVDKDGNPVSADKAKLSQLEAALTPASGNNIESTPAAFANTDITYSVDATTGKITFAVADVKPNTKGTLTISRTTANSASPITPASIPLEVKPIEVTTSPVVSTIKIDLKNSDPRFNVYLKANGTGAFSALAVLNTGTNQIGNESPVNSSASIQFKMGSASAEGQKGTSTISGKVAGITFKPLAIPYDIVNTTVKPVLTDVGTIELDLNPTTSESKPVTLVSASSRSGTVPALTVGTAGKYTKASDGSENDFSPLATTSPVLTASADGNIVTVKRTALTVPGVYKIPIAGNIKTADSGTSDVDLAPYTLVVNVKDTTATKVSYFTIDPSSINKTVVDSAFFMTVKAFNAAGTEIKPIPTGAIKFYSIDEDDVPVEQTGTAGTNALTVVETGTAGQFTVKTQNPFTGKLAVRGAGGVYANATELRTDLAVGGVAVTAAATPALSSLDLINASDVVIKLTAPTGVTAIDVTGVVATNPTNFDVNEIDSTGGTAVTTGGIAKFNSSKNEIYLRHDKIGKGKLTISGKVTTADGDFPFDNIVLDYQIKNTMGLVSTPAKVELSLKEGGLKVQNVTFTCNPSAATLNLTKVESNNVAAATVEKVSGTTYKVTAVSKGSGLIIVEGTVGGVATTLTVPFTVDSDASEVTLVPTPASATLYLKGTNDVTFSAKGSDGTDATEVAFAAYTGDIVKVDGLKVTGLKEGSAELTLNGKVAGVALTTKVTVTVKDEVSPTEAGIYIAGKLYKDGDTFFVPNNFKLNDYKVTRKTDDGAEITAVTLSRTYAKSAKVKKHRLNIKGTSIVPTQVFGKTKLTVKATGLADLTIELNVARLPEEDNTKVPGITENPQAGTRGYFFDYQTTNTAEAYYTQPKFWNFKTSKESVAKVKANGIIEFYKAGTVTLTATRKSNNKSLVTKFTLNLTVTDEYLNTGSWVAVLSNSTKKDAIAGVLSSQNYPKGTAGASYDYTKAGYDEMIAYLQANAKETDVSAVYIDGAITKNGFTLSGTTISLTDLAADLAKVPGKIFLTLNGAASTLYSSKDIDATPADIAKVFAAAEAGVQSKATALSTVGTNGFWSSQKFYVLSATSKKSQTSVSATKADAVADAFIKALTLTDGKFSNGDTRLTLKELYTKVKKDSGKVIGYYPSAVKGVAVGYNYVP